MSSGNCKDSPFHLTHQTTPFAITYPMKLFLLLCFGFACIVVVIVRKISFVAGNASANALANKIRKNSAAARKVIDSLDIPYSEKENFPAAHFEKLKSYVQSVKIVGDYTLVFAGPTAEDELFFITELAFTDFDVNLNGRHSDVKKKAHHYFVMKFNRAENKLTTLSDIFSDSTDKFQKQGFVNAVFKGV